MHPVLDYNLCFSLDTHLKLVYFPIHILVFVFKSICKDILYAEVHYFSALQVQIVLFQSHARSCFTVWWHLLQVFTGHLVGQNMLASVIQFGLL